MTSNNKPSEQDAAIGNRIQRTRMALGLSRLSVSKKLGIGQMQLRRNETGENRVPADRIIQLADILGVSPDYFFADFSSTSEFQVLSHFVNTAEGIALNQAFNQIQKPDTRAGLVALVDACG